MRKFWLGLLLGLLAFPTLVLAAGYLGLLRTQATADPPRWEQSFAQKAFCASVARHAPRVTNPLTPTEDNLLAGMRTYRANCAGCHGDSTQRSDWGTRDFYPCVPQFAFEHPKKPDWQMFWIVQHGVRYSGMAGWEDQLPQEKIWQVVTFLSRIESLPPAVAAKWQNPTKR